MVRVIVLGQGFVGSVFTTGIERLKNKEIGYEGIPLSEEISIKTDEIDIVGSYDVDDAKVGKTVADVCKHYVDGKIPEKLSNIKVKKGIHLGSLKNLPLKPCGKEENKSIKEAAEELLEEWEELKPDAIVNVCTTESFTPFKNKDEFLKAINEDSKDRLTASQVYFYAACLYSKKINPLCFINTIPTLLANDVTCVEFAKECKLTVFGDDGATGATPFTADILTHLAQRNRRVIDIAQFNIGGNMDFLALTDEGRNKSKEYTKSSIVKDILGYDAPHYIKPTGFLEPLGDKKFISVHIEYESFNGSKDELIINGRINDSPALAGLIVDLVRLGKIAVERKVYGTVYDINAFYMKNPGPSGNPNIPRIIAYEKLRKWVGINPKWM